VIREERNALVLVLLFAAGAAVLYAFVVRPALEGAIVIEPVAASGTEQLPEVAIDPLLDMRPKAAKRMFTIRALVRDAATGLGVTGIVAEAQNVEDIAEPECRIAGDGVLLVEYLPPDTFFDLSITARGYRPRVIARLRGAAREALDLGVVALAPERELRGDVRDAAAQPLALARVAAFPLGEADSGADDFDRARRLAEALERPAAATASCDDNGRFVLRGLTPGEHLIQVVHEGYAPIVHPGIDLRWGDARVDTVLHPGCAARARVTTPDGEPLGGGTVTLVAATPPRDGPLSLAVARTAPDGALALPSLEPGPHFVFVSGGGAARSALGPRWLPPLQEMRITVEKGVTLQGRVRDADGIAIQGATIEAARTDRSGLVARGVSDADGLFEITGLAPGPTRVRVAAFGFASDEAVIPLASFGFEHRATLHRGGLIEGVVTAGNDGTPVLGARVRVIGQGLSTVTDEKGGFRLPGVTAGPARIEVTAIGFTAARRDVELRLTDNAPLPFALDRGGEIRVRVIDSVEAALANARVAIVALDDGERPRLRDLRFAMTDALGTARCVDLENGRRYALIASRDGLAPARSESFVLGPEHLRRGFALTLRQGATLFGRVTDGSGNAVPLARILARSLLDDPLESLLVERAQVIAISDSEGRYELSDLPAGEYRLEVEAIAHHRLFTPSVALAEAERRVGYDLVLAPARPVYGAVRGRDGLPIAGARVELRSRDPLRPPQVEAATDSAGRFYFLTPDPPPFDLGALAPARGEALLEVLDTSAAPPFYLDVEIE
jgi:hypothetical protein